jgi:hypothetical protein
MLHIVFFFSVNFQQCFCTSQLPKAEYLILNLCQPTFEEYNSVRVPILFVSDLDPTFHKDLDPIMTDRVVDLNIL